MVWPYLLVGSGTVISSSAHSCWILSTFWSLFSFELSLSNSTGSGVFGTRALKIVESTFPFTTSVAGVWSGCSLSLSGVGVCETSGASRSLDETNTWKSSSAEEHWSWQILDGGTPRRRWELINKGEAVCRSAPLSKRVGSGWTKSNASTPLWVKAEWDVRFWHRLLCSLLEFSSLCSVSAGLAETEGRFSTTGLFKWTSGV